MTRTAPELAPPLQTSAPHRRLDIWPLCMIWGVAGPIHGGSSVASGFRPATLRFRGRDLTTRPPRPIFYIVKPLYSILVRRSDYERLILVNVTNDCPFKRPQPRFRDY
ncbi:hypothetical protein AVEN_69574-1 [Araneus ventricosus]|uniref:Uncharacterized protein n=1 Tax=Araneus ventricosus TaxID=182803 RepID=A0A4Y2HAD5_ARAVE|nr:hypothetical protein AVEN_69574-1 [Araneus ventricosus]